ncbi:NADH-quinone oxidoreductase subunit C [bacterium]|nr:NADH-quinone oxidoreductase subunit C [bacterium]
MVLHNIKNIFNDITIDGDKLFVKSNIYQVLNFIKNNYHFNLLKEIIAIDNKDAGIELIYHLYNIEDDENVFISITTKEEIESVSQIFNSAIADEKEIYDMFGINFIGHKELKRLYMPETWQGHPLRKDYVEEDARLNWNEKT